MLLSVLLLHNRLELIIIGVFLFYVPFIHKFNFTFPIKHGFVFNEVTFTCKISKTCEYSIHLYDWSNVYLVLEMYWNEKTQNKQQRRKSKGKSGMGNLETVTTLGTEDTGRRQTKIHNTTQKTKMMSHTDSTKNQSEPRCSLEAQWGKKRSIRTKKEMKWTNYTTTSRQTRTLTPN